MAGSLEIKLFISINLSLPSIEMSTCCELWLSVLRSSLSVGRLPLEAAWHNISSTAICALLLLQCMPLTLKWVNRQHLAVLRISVSGRSICRAFGQTWTHLLTFEHGHLRAHFASSKRRRRWRWSRSWRATTSQSCCVELLLLLYPVLIRNLHNKKGMLRQKLIKLNRDQMWDNKRT